MEDSSSYLTVAEVAARIRVSAPSVLTLIRRGEIIASNVSMGIRRPRWRINPADLDRWLASRQTRPTTRITRRRRMQNIIEFF